MVNNMNFLSLLPSNITVGEAALVTVVCMIIVFLMLALLWGIVALFKFIPAKKEKAKEEAPVVSQPAARPAIKMSDIKDDDMMVAALVATIDYHEEIKEDVRVVSIKEI